MIANDHGGAMSMNRQFLWLAAILAFLLPVAAAAQSLDPAALFPELDGWSRDGKTESFGPDNLYEHIDGAAENFLACGFERLAVQNYVNAGKQSLTAEIYFHGTPENAFAIYASEKPLAGDYLAVGSEGYAEEGVLNFISDAFYVKLNSFDLAPAQSGALPALAEKIVAAIHGRNELPAALAAFPVRGKVAHSERYILNNFLGLDFLGAAFSADYEAPGEKFRLFVMKTKGGDHARALLTRWAALDKGRSAGEMQPGSLTINDPYNGPVRLYWQGAFICGGLGGGEEVDGLLKELAEKLAR
jgi:hypothetical protein